MKTAISIKASELATAYEQNEVSADNKYKNQSLQIKGVVNDISKDFLNTPILQLRGKGMFMNVQAYMDESELPALASMNKGQPVTLACTGDGVIMGNPIVRFCKIIRQGI